MPRNTWWLDSSATTHVSVSMQGCPNYRKLTDAKRNIFVGGKSVAVQAIWHFRILLSTGFYLDLKDTFIVPSFRLKFGFNFFVGQTSFSCSFGNYIFTLSLNSSNVGTGCLNALDNLYMLDTIVS